MSNTDKKISYLDFKNLGQTMMANAKYIIGISIIGLLIGFLLSLSEKKDSYRVISDVVFDELKYDILERQFDLILEDRFPTIVNTYITAQLAEDDSTNYPFSIKEGGKYETKIVAIIDETDKKIALKKFENLSNSIKRAFETYVYQVYMSKVNNIKYTYSKMNKNDLISGSESIPVMDDSIDFLDEFFGMGFYLGTLNEKITRGGISNNSSFFDTNSNYEDYEGQLLLNGIRTDEPSILFRDNHKTVITRVGEEFNFAPLLGLLIGFFISVVLIIFIKSKNYGK